MTPPAGLETSWTLEVRDGYTDLAGNTGTSQLSQAQGVDTRAPAAPTLDPIAGNDRIDALERTAGVTLTGTAEPHARLTLNLAGVARTVTVGESGAWSYALSEADYAALGQGSGIPVAVRATDVAGNIGPAATR